MKEKQIFNLIAIAGAVAGSVVYSIIEANKAKKTEVDAEQIKAIVAFRKNIDNDIHCLNLGEFQPKFVKEIR